MDASRKLNKRNRVVTRPQWLELGDFFDVGWLDGGVKLRTWRDIAKTSGHMANLPCEQLYHLVGDRYGCKSDDVEIMRLGQCVLVY
jgi:hypothetical protein